MIDHDLAAELDELAARIAQIRPMSNSNPDAFYEERSEVAHGIRSLASRVRTGQPTAATDLPAPTRLGEAFGEARVGRQVIARSVRHIEGRTVLVLNRSAP